MSHGFGLRREPLFGEKRRGLPWGTGHAPAECRVQNAECRIVLSVTIGDTRLAAARSQNGSGVINTIHYRSAASLPKGRAFTVEI